MNNEAVELAAPVLLIDDDEDSRVMYRTILAHAGIEVVTVTDGGDGLEVARAVKPSVIVLDIGLPTMSGLEVLQRVRQDSALSETAVIALTGHVLKEQQQELVDETHIERFGCGVDGVERARTIVHLNGEAIQRFKQVVYIIDDKIDQLGV